MSMIPEELEFESEQDSLLFLAEFTGLGYNRMLDFTLKDIKKMAATAIKALSTMDVTSKLPESITLKGQRFCLVDPEKIGIGWHIDWNKSAMQKAIEKDPVRLACLFYLPEGYNYSDVDQNGNITHPIASRYELFKEEFPLDLFIRCTNFFLVRSLTSTRRSMVREIAQKNRRKINTGMAVLNLFNGKARLKLS